MKCFKNVRLTVWKINKIEISVMLCEQMNQALSS